MENKRKWYNFIKKELLWKLYFNEKRKFIETKLKKYCSSQIIEHEQAHYCTLKSEVQIILKNSYPNVEDTNLCNRSIINKKKELGTTIRIYCVFVTEVCLFFLLLNYYLKSQEF